MVFKKRKRYIQKTLEGKEIKLDPDVDYTKEREKIVDFVEYHIENDSDDSTFVEDIRDKMPYFVDDLPLSLEIDENENDIEYGLKYTYNGLKKVYYGYDVCRMIRETDFKNIDLNKIGWSWSWDKENVDEHYADGSKDFKPYEDVKNFLLCGKFDLHELNIPDTFSINIINNQTESEAIMKNNTCVNIDKVYVIKRDIYGYRYFDQKDDSLKDISLPLEVCSPKESF